MPLCRTAARCRKLSAAVLLAGGLLSALSACTTEEIIGSTIGATVLGANSPSQEIQQIYYLGAFDPQEQLPPTVYRIRVKGQASFISFVRFASGWVPAPFIDSLSSSVAFSEETTAVNIDARASDKLSRLTTGRRLMLFGPEGFREAPKDHRLVVVMGSNPEDFFNAIDTSIGAVAQAIDEQRNARLGRILFEALARIETENDRLDTLAKDVDADLPAAAGGAGQ